MARHVQPRASANPTTPHDVERILNDAPAYRQLDPATKTALRDSLSKIATMLSRPAAQLAEQFAPDLRSRLSPTNDNRGAAAPAPSPRANGQDASPAKPAAGQGTTGRVGEVARATLNAIDFPGFVASLIQGTFQAIVDASIQQMEAYAELLKNVAGSVDRFMDDHVSDGTARDYLADRYGGLLTRDASSGTARLSVNKDAPKEEMPGFFKDLGFESPDDIDDEAIDQVIVPAARKSLAETRQQTLATMVLMGINRVVVDDGEIMAKLVFHIDASETTELRFDQTKTTAGTMAGRAGRNAFTANAIMVNTTSLNAQSDINVRADLTGQVKVKFRSETFPLERFADSAAIQLINSNARVPPPAAAAPATAAPGGTAPAGAAPTPPAAPPPAVAPPPVSQGLAAPTDPWAPREGS